MSTRKLIDIGANLTDKVFNGIYHGSKKHQDDFVLILKRALDVGVDKMIVTSGCLEDSKEALKLIEDNESLYTTVGCHPTRCSEFDDTTKAATPDEYYEMLSELIANNLKKVVAVGECGLDYDRLHFCPKETQLKYFEKQLKLSSAFNLPLFLHHRNCHEDFREIVLRNLDFMPRRGVVHSFDGTLEQARFFLSNGFYIGLNGCSLKTEENLEVVKELPVDKLMIETDAPWCEIKQSHASYKFVQTKFHSVKKEKWNENSLVKGRNEPCCIIHVLEVIAALKDYNIDKLAEIIYENTVKMFFPGL